MGSKDDGAEDPGFLVREVVKEVVDYSVIDPSLRSVQLEPSAHYNAVTFHGPRNLGVK